MNTTEEKNEAITRKIACDIVDGGVKISMLSLRSYSAYCKGLRDAYALLFPRMIALSRGEDQVYMKAEYDLLMSSSKKCYDYNSGRYTIGYKDHVRDKSGKLIKCTAYLVPK